MASDTEPRFSDAMLLFAHIDMEYDAFRSVVGGCLEFFVEPPQWPAEGAEGWWLHMLGGDVALIVSHGFDSVAVYAQHLGAIVGLLATYPALQGHVVWLPKETAT